MTINLYLTQCEKLLPTFRSILNSIYVNFVAVWTHSYHRAVYIPGEAGNSLCLRSKLLLNGVHRVTDNLLKAMRLVITGQKVYNLKQGIAERLHQIVLLKKSVINEDSPGSS